MTVFRCYYTRATGRGLRAAFGLAKKQGRSIRAIAKVGGVSHTTGYKWAVRQDLADRLSGPVKGTGQIILSEVARELITVLRKRRLDIAQLCYALNSLEPLNKQERQGISVWTVRRFLEEAGLNRLPKNELPPNKPVKGVFAATSPGFIHVDTIFAPSTDGVPGRFIYVAIERTTRWLYMEARQTRQAIDGKGFLVNLLAACPLKIHTILADNGSEWEAEFNAYALEQMIKHKHTKPHSPQTNGLVERMNGTIKRKTPFKTKDFWRQRPSEHRTPGRMLQGFYTTDTRFERINKDFKQWCFFWNAVRPHQVLQWQTPFERLQALYLAKPDLFQFDPSLRLPLDLEDWKVRLGANRFIYPPPGIGNRTPS